MDITKALERYNEMLAQGAGNISSLVGITKQLSGLFTRLHKNLLGSDSFGEAIRGASLLIKGFHEALDKSAGVIGNFDEAIEGVIKKMNNWLGEKPPENTTKPVKPTPSN